MELDRPHLRSSSSSNNATNNNNELFICFASRLSSSSSSMKIAKSILSPGRAACDAPASLSNSLSRRLKSNGSMKGGQASPMFPSVGKKKGCNFENPEPSSPKVTCIGQVRVKTKKKASQTRSLSRRRSGGEVSFRKAGGESHEFVSLNNEDRFSGRNSRHVQECLPERNQRWVHFPVTICEALRAVGAEFSCLFPCGSSCFSTKEKEEKSSTIRDERDQESCGAVFARWFVSLQDCEGRQAKQIELVVGGDEDRSHRTEVTERKSMRSSRRHVFENIQFNQEKIELKVEEEDEQEEEKGRVSICVPPKNALLLMRCRSDPIQMAALTNRVWESPALTKEEEEEEEEEEEDEDEPDEEISKKDAFLREFSRIINKTEPVVGHEKEESQDFILGDDEKGFESVEKDSHLVEEMEDNEEGKTDEQLQYNEESQQLQIEEQTLMDAILRSSEAHAIQEVGENMHHEVIEEENGEEESCSPSRHSSSSRDLDELAEKMETEDEKSEPEAAAFEEFQENENKPEDLSVEEKVLDPVDDEMQITTRLESQEDPENSSIDAENDRLESTIAERVNEKGEKFEEKEDESFSETKRIDNESSTTSSSPPPAKVLPDCLLLMMCEPKLSMDMSKETWVCSTDFVRWLPERPVKKVNDESKKTITTEVLNLNTPQQPPAAAAQDSKTRKKKQQQTMQPPRSSCTLPAAAAASMATMIEQKLVNAVGYEPCVLTRCKSEPMRTAAAKLVPDACCWKNRKLEPHRQAAFGVGAAGLGF